MEDNEKVLREKLKNYDWFYSLSHDPSLWLKGMRDTIEIEKIIASNPKLKEIYDEEKSKRFSN